MPASFILRLDTTGPQNVAVVLEGGAASTGVRDILAAITTDDPDTTGYRVKIWGDVDPAFSPDIQPLENDSSYVMLATPHAVRLSAGDGVKTINVRLLDHLDNPSAPASDTITLDTVAPVVTILTGPDPDEISKQPTKDTASFTWSADSPFEEYKFKVVPASGSDHTQGVEIGTANGSTNMSGAAGGYPADTPITSTIKGADYELATGGDGDFRVKAFVRDENGNWSVGG